MPELVGKRPTGARHDAGPDVEARLRDVFAAVFPVDGVILTDDDSPATIAEWDSISHISLVFAVEEEFGIEFDPGVIADMRSFGDMRITVLENSDHG